MVSSPMVDLSVNESEDQESVDLSVDSFMDAETSVSGNHEGVSSFLNLLAPAALDERVAYNINRLSEDARTMNDRTARVAANEARRQAFTSDLYETLLPPTDASAIIMHQRELESDPMSGVLEQRFASFASLLASENEQEDEEDDDEQEIIEVEAENVEEEETIGVLEDTVAKITTIQTWLNRLNKEWDDDRTYAGLVGDFVSLAIPGWETYKLGLPTTRAERYRELWAMPAHKFASEVEKDLSEMENAFFRSQYVEGLLSYTNSDQMIDGVFQAIDLFGLAPLGKTLVSRLKGATSLASVPSISLPQAVKAMGNNVRSAKLGVSSLASATINPITAKQGTIAAGQLLPDALNVNFGSLPNTNAGLAQSLLAHRTQTGATLATIMNTHYVERLGTEALSVALDNSFKNFQRQLGGLKDRIVATSPLERDPLSNTFNVSYYLGNARMEGYATERAAKQQATATYKLHPESYSIEELGGKHYIKVNKGINETLDDVLEKNLIETSAWDDDRSFIRTVIAGKLGTPQEFLSAFERAQRNTAVNASAAVFSAVRDILKPLNLPKRKARRLSKILNEGHTIRNSNGTRGKWFSYDEFTSLYQKFFGVDPTDQEAAAYFAIKDISDLDYAIRSADLMKKIERMGIEKVFFNGEDYFYGTMKGGIPRGEEAVGLWSNAKKGIDGQLSSADVKKHLKANPNDRIVRLASPGKDGVFDDDIYEYVIVRSPQFSRVKREELLKYEGGGHTKVAGNYFIKIDRKGKRGYTAGETFFNFGTMKSALRSTELLNDLLDNYRAFKAGNITKTDFLTHLSNSSSLTYKQFVALAKQMPKGSRFVATEGNSRLINEAFVDNRKFLLDELDDPFDAMTMSQTIYTKDRKVRELRTVDLDDAQDKIMGLDVARYEEPFDVLAKSIQNMVSLARFEDYKLSAVETFNKKFRRFMDNDVNDSAMDILFNPKWKARGVTNEAIVERGKAEREMIIALLQAPTETTKLLQRMRKGWMEWAGEDSFKANSYLWKKLSYTGGGDAVMGNVRAMAFHTKLGLGNIAQFVVQASAAPLAWAISPKAAAQGIPLQVGFYLRSIFGEDASLVKFVSELSGLSDANVKAFFKHMDDSGAVKITTNIADLNHGIVVPREDVGLLRKSGRKVLDFGLVPFMKGEQVVRANAHAMAFVEHMNKYKKAPTKMQEFSAISLRANDLFFNMGRDSNAYWQRGLLSIPTQFFSFFVRYHELLFGKRLTLGEKARLLMASTAMYGLSGSTAIGYLGEYFATNEESLAETGMDLQNVIWNGLANGLTGSDFSDRLGPGAGRFDIFNPDTPFVSVLAGAGGNILWDIVKSTKETAYPGLRLLLKSFHGAPEPDTKGVAAGMIFSVLKNISTINNTQKAWMAYQTDKLYSRSGILLMDGVSNFDALMITLGFSPEEATKAYEVEKFLQGQKDSKAAKLKVGKVLGSKMLDALAAGELEEAEKYATALTKFGEIFDLTMQDKVDFYNSWVGANKSKVQAIQEQLINRATDQGNSELLTLLLHSMGE